MDRHSGNSVERTDGRTDSGIVCASNHGRNSICWETVILNEVKLIYKQINDFHYFLGGDEWSHGLIVLDMDYDVAREEALIMLRELLKTNHNIACGEWEFID